MRVLFLTIGDETVASSRSRVFQYLPHLRRAGVHSLVLPYRTSWYVRLRLGTARERFAAAPLAPLEKVRSFIWSALALGSARWADVLFIQKVFPPLPVARALTRTGLPLILDYDDAVYADPAYDRRSLEYLIGRANLVVVENEAAESFARDRGRRTLRITGPIDVDRYRPVARKDDGLCRIVWIGSPTTTRYLGEMERPLQRLVKEFPHLTLRVIGGLPVAMQGVRLEQHRWSLHTETSYLGESDIGIMPLPKDEWTLGKGGYKLLQYMAMALPSVASPVGVNSEIITHGKTGFLASSENEWVEAMRQLIFSADLRRELGRAARDRAERIYSFDAATPRLLAELRTLAAGR